jgi:hypothetical protein
MPTVTAAQIIDRASIALQDIGNVRWKRPELLDDLNAGQRETVIRKPTAYTRLSTATMVAGTVQTLPTTDGTATIDPIQLIDVLRNACGRAVRVIERDLMDLHNPDWHSATQTKLVQHYMVNVLDPTRFLVYPPNDGTGCLEVVYSANPPPIATEGAVIALDDIYQDALLDYVLYRAFSKDAEYAADPARAAARYAAFLSSLDGKTRRERTEAPVLNRR